jgi:hypothetical protein
MNILVKAGQETATAKQLGKVVCNTVRLAPMMPVTPAAKIYDQQLLSSSRSNEAPVTRRKQLSSSTRSAAVMEQPTPKIRT